jgi:hypothetical protein
MMNASRRIAFAVAALGLVVGTAGQARAELVLTFDDLGIASNQGTVKPANWNYGGLNFKGAFFQAVYGDQVEQGAHNGTDVLINGYTTEFTSKTDGGTFTLNSFDIGLSFYTNPTDTVTLTLNYLGGGSTTSVLNLTQNFQTVTVNAANLTSVDLGTPTLGGYIALDNISYDAPISAPEPSTLVMIASAVPLGIGWWLRRRRRAA